MNEHKEGREQVSVWGNAHIQFVFLRRQMKIISFSNGVALLVYTECLHGMPAAQVL